eukprot:5224540-Prorocentrum_lima.AAC.1
MMDKLEIPVNRIPSDFITQGHTAGVAYKEAETQGPTDRKVIGKAGKTDAEGYIVREVAAEMVFVP